MSSGGTLTDLRDERGRSTATSTALLHLVLECERPLAGSVRHVLAGVDVVRIGRDGARTAARDETAGERTLAIGVPDRWMSSAHSRLVRVLGKWLVEDAGSKNGTFVNGEPVQRTELADGDVLEIGHTFFLFRETAPLGPGAPLLTESAGAMDPSAPDPAPPGLVTLVPALAADFARLAEVARSGVSVVLHGESGTGKELVARAIHRLSGRTGPFVAVNCGGLPRSLLESELFGHRKGAFSGATEDRPGLVRSAERGTLLLDEVGELPRDAQPAFLRVLQEREVTPVGSAHPIPVDVRLVAATHRDLAALVAEGGFRPDLAARLAGFTLTLPPLRDRREDLGLILGELLRRAGAERVRFAAPAARALLTYDWPLHVRELEKCLGAAVVLAGDGPIDLAHLPPAVQAAAAPPAPAALSEDDARRRDELVALLREHAGNVSAVARAMGKARMQIQRWLKRWGLDPASFRD